MNKQTKTDRGLARTLWPVALVAPATALIFAGYASTRDTGGFDWALVLAGVIVGVVAFGLLLAYDTWRSGRAQQDTHTAPMKLAESPVVWIPPIVIIAIVLTFVFNQQ
jgi:heme/copper-type cytochrome/quinol oxidase subunit 2